jgi:hypothetical protein
MEGSSEASVAAFNGTHARCGRGENLRLESARPSRRRFLPRRTRHRCRRTGHGKTTVILNLLLHWLESYPNDRFILYSYEIPAESVLIKLVSSLTRKIGANGWTL